jgi:hypothetical protein
MTDLLQCVRSGYDGTGEPMRCIPRAVLGCEVRLQRNQRALIRWCDVRCRSAKDAARRAGQLRWPGDGGFFLDGARSGTYPGVRPLYGRSSVDPRRCRAPLRPCRSPMISISKPARASASRIGVEEGTPSPADIAQRQRPLADDAVPIVQPEVTQPTTLPSCQIGSSPMASASPASTANVVSRSLPPLSFSSSAAARPTKSPFFRSTNRPSPASYGP